MIAWTPICVLCLNRDRSPGPQGREVDPVLRGTMTTLEADLFTINLHVRGGHVLPFQQPANNTVYR